MEKTMSTKTDSVGERTLEVEFKRGRLSSTQVKDIIRAGHKYLYVAFEISISPRVITFTPKAFTLKPAGGNESISWKEGKMDSAKVSLSTLLSGTVLVDLKVFSKHLERNKTEGYFDFIPTAASSLTLMVKSETGEEVKSAARPCPPDCPRPPIDSRKKEDDE